MSMRQKKVRTTPLMRLGARVYYAMVNSASGNLGEGKLGKLFPPDFQVSAVAARARMPKQVRMQIEGGMTRQGGVSRPVLAVPDLDPERPRDDRCRIWRGYKLGTRFPPLERESPDRPTLVERVDNAIPGTAAWIATPLWWFTSERMLSLPGITSLIERMPVPYQDELVARSTGPIEISLRRISRETVKEFAISGGPWGLGAIACAVRIAQITGAAPIQRYASIHLLNTLRAWKDHSALKSSYAEVYKIIEDDINTAPYNLPGSGSLFAPISINEVDAASHEISEECDARRKQRKQLNEEIEDALNQAFSKAANAQSSS